MHFKIYHCLRQKFKITCFRVFNLHGNMIFFNNRNFAILILHEQSKTCTQSNNFCMKNIKYQFKRTDVKGKNISKKVKL